MNTGTQGGIKTGDCVEVTSMNFKYNKRIGKVTEVWVDSWDGEVCHVLFDNGEVCRCQTHKLIKHKRQVCGDE